MLKQTRVSGATDVGRLANAVSRPGIDPRVWVCLAIVQSVTVDPEEGVFCDVLLLPDGTEETARLASVYAGSNFGAHFPVEVDDEVMVLAPSGNPDEGLVILPKLHSPADPPPQEVVNNPTDVVIKLKSGKNIRIVVNDGGLVHLGSETGAEFVALAQKVLDRLHAIEDKYNSHVHPGVSTGVLSTLQTAQQMSSSDSVAAEKVKAT